MPDYNDSFERVALIIFFCAYVVAIGIMDLTEKNAKTKDLNLYEQKGKLMWNDRKRQNNHLKRNYHQLRHRISLWRRTKIKPNLFSPDN
jgi:hypothetical protein